MLHQFGLIKAKSCIRFVKRTHQIDYVEVMRGIACNSFIGRIRGRQVVNMGEGCFNEGTATHKMIHALGWHHMHSDLDRDNYVKILWENIQPGRERNFEMVDPNRFGSFNTPYDLKSVMLYRRRALSVNGEDTVVPHDSAYIDVIGRTQFGDGDAMRLNRMYQCANL
jgi:Astacin (Peptidase family M12A)